MVDADASVTHKQAYEAYLKEAEKKGLVCRTFFAFKAVRIRKQAKSDPPKK